MRLKHFISVFLALLFLGVGQMWASDVTGTINFGSATGSTNVNTSPKTGDDSQGNTWTVTTVGTTSFTPNASYAQIGSGSKPATSITFTTTLPSAQTIKSFSAKFGGFSGTAGTVTLKVGNTSVGSGSLNGTSDVTVTNTNTTTSGTVLTVTVTSISKGVKAYYISYSYTPSSGPAEPTISVQPVGATYVKDATPTALSVTAAAGNGGALSYQWYSNTTSSTTGASSISGATNASYTPSTADLGTKYYYCVVSEAGVATTVTSSIVAVVVKEPTGTFNKFTGTTLTEGDYVLTYNTYTLANSVSSSRWTNGDAITKDVASLTNPDASVIWHLSKSGDYWLLYNADVEKYAAGTSTKNQGSMVDMPQGGASNMMKWTATYAATGKWDFENYGRSQASSDSGNKWLRNNGSNGWACYASGTNGALTLYKKALPTHKVTFTAAPTGGAVAVSVGGSPINTNADVEEGATVTITPTPSDYYQIASVTKGGQAITPIQGVYSFTMPTSDVAIAVTFELIPVTAVTLNKTELALVAGNSETLSVSSVTPDGASNTVTWSSTDETVATVTNAGVVSALKAGSTTIKATSTVNTSVFGSCALTVTAPTGNPVTITQTTGGTVTANVDVSDVLKDVPVTLTATPTAGYSVSGWTIVGVDAGDLTISIDKTTCSFAMPDGEVLAEASFTHETATLKLVELGVENTYDSENTHYWKESVTLPGLSGLGCSDKVFRGWSADANCTTEPTLKAGDSYEIPNKGENKLYAVFATASEGSTSWDEITAVPTAAGEYAICTETYFMKASIASNRFENGDATPSITDGVLDEAPASDCIWELSINGDGKFLFKNGTKYAAGNGTKNQGALNTSATDTKSQWTITYNNGFVITNVYNSAQSVNAVLRQNGTYGWAAYGETQNGAAGAPRLFKKTVGAASYTGYTTECEAQLPVLAAPTFPVAEGVFYESTDITISAATGASIYYTTDGTTPSSTNGTLYEGAITLNAYGTYNFKAIAVQAGHEDSPVAEATYYFGETFASVSDLYTYLETNSLTSMNNVKVTGLVSRITAAWDAQKGYLTYYISDNGVAENDLQMYRGAGEGASALAVGDQVTVTGNYVLYNSSIHEFAADNTIVARTAAAVASVAIGGAAEKTTYSPEDNQFSHTGLTATATYNTGYTKDVTALATWTNNLENNTVAASGNVEVTATYEGKSDMKEVAVTYTSKTLDHITLSYSSTTVYVGMALPTPTVTASYVEDIEDEDVTELVAAANGFDTESAYNGNVAGSYTINVSYTLGEVTRSAEYTVTVKSVFNNEENPHKVADATAMIIASAYQSTTSSTDYMWVRGIVSGFNGNNLNRYYISEDGSENGQLYVYNGKYFNNATFTESNKLHVGDEIVVKATILNYNGNTPELTGSQVVSQLREPEFAIADIVAGDEFEANVSEDMTVVPTVNSGDAEFTLTSGNEAVVTIANGKLHAVAEGDAEITASRAATSNANALNYKAKEITFNVHVIAERTRYTVTFDANGGEGTDPEAIANQLAGATVDMPTSTPLYNKEGNAFTGWKVINLSTEAEIEVENDQFEMPAANVKIQAQWAVVATCAISFQVGGQEVATANAPQEADYNIPANTTHPTVDGFTFLGWSETEYADEVETAPTLINVYHAQAGENSKVLYGIYSRLDDSEGNKHYVLNYATDVASKTLAYGSEVNVTASDGSQWVVKAAKNSGMQLNTGKNSSIKIPTCPNKIINIDITCTVAYSVGLSASNYSGSGTITYIESGTNATSQTLDLSGKTVTEGYIVPKGGATAITNIDITYDGSKTYYTSSPVEKVTITFDANGGNGGCTTTTINKGSELTICADVPTKLHSEFAGWKNGETIYEAGQAYTFDADITLTAQWNEASTYTVTYNVNGSEEAAPTQEDQYAGDQFTLAAAVTKDGYTFKGWEYNNKLYKAGKTFTMPAANVEFVANWKKDAVATEKMNLITEASALVDGLEFALGCSYGENSFAMAGEFPSGKKYFASISGNAITLNNGLASFTDDVIILIAEQAANGWKIRKDATNYLTITGSDIKWDTQTNATTWTISFSNGNVNIENGNNKIQFNAQDPRFKTYTSQTDIQMFSKATVVTANANISDLGNVDGETVVVTSGTTLTANTPSAPEALVIQEGAKYVAEAQTTTPVVHFSVTMGSENPAGDETTASELEKAFNIILTTGGEIHYDITWGTSMGGTQADPNQWHAFTVPFPVDVLNGIYNAETGAKLTNEVDYAIMDYHGDIRANGQYGWKKYRGTLVPGTFYIITITGQVPTFRFKQSATGALQNITSKDIEAYSGTGEDKDQGWNGVGNPSWLGGKVGYDVQVLDPYSYTFVTKYANTTNFKPGTPFFYKAGSTSPSSIVMAEANASANYAPARTPANEIKNLIVRFGNEVFVDKLCISASEDALNSYEQDKDLVKMTMSKTPKVAQIFGDAYGMKLSMVNTPLVNNNAEVALELYAPAAGEYTISAQEVDGYNVYLTREGMIIWNLSDGAYTADFEKGNNAGYGIRIVKAPKIATGIENGESLDGANGVQKVIIDEHVYILRGEQMFDVTGKMVK